MLDPWIWMCQGLSIFSSSAWRAMSTQMTWRGCLVRCSSRPIMMIEFDPSWDPQNHNKWVIKTIEHVVVYDIVLWLSVQSTVIPILNATQLIFTLIIKLIYKDKDVSPLCSIIIWQPQTSGSEDKATTFLHEPRVRLGCAGPALGHGIAALTSGLPSASTGSSVQTGWEKSNRLSQRRNFRTFRDFFRDLMWFC